MLLLTVFCKRGEVMQNRFLLNTHSGTVHDTKNCDGRCKIKLMRDEFKMYFDNLDEALSYLKTEKPTTKKCSFCFKK